MSLRAAARVVERGINAIFVYAGRDLDPTNVTVTTLIRELGLGNRVRLLGERQDVARLYAAFDLYWMSSWARGMGEGFPNVVAEAMACGVPCVTTDVGEAAHVIGTTGRVVPSRDPAALAEGVVELLSPGVDLQRLGREARARIERNFSLGSVLEEYETLYRELLVGSGPK